MLTLEQLSHFQTQGYVVIENAVAPGLLLAQGIGRWGNGDVEIGLSRLEDLPYVIGLVRQSLELQLGNGGDV